MHELNPDYYKDLLLTIYPCKVPFSIAVRDDRPRRRLGTYYFLKQRIILHCGKGVRTNPVETAIHEYAHHIHYTEFNCRERRDAPHGKQFWQIYGQLMCHARSLGIIQDTLVQDPVLVFPTDTPSTAAAGAPSRKSDIDLDGELPPSLRHALRELLKCVYDWLNRD